MKQSTPLLISVAAALFSVGVSAQTCNSQLYQNTPNERFILGDGLAIDKRTNLVWQRCVLGQAWNKTTKRCEFSPVLKNWRDALDSAPEGWRLPNVKELTSIVEHSCRQPSINSSIFPEGSGGFWSSTVSRRIDISSTGGVINDHSNYAWFFDYGTFGGKNQSTYKTREMMVRYVKDYQPNAK